MSDYKSCSNCGATIPADSLFCERCGQPLGGVPPPPSSYEPVARPYESPPSPPARMPPLSRPQRRIDKRFLLSVLGTAIALIFLFATVIGPDLSSITGPHATASPSIAASQQANPSKSMPTPTVNPKTADYSSYFDNAYRGNWSVVQPFAKSTNDRGNDVYTGILKHVTFGIQSKFVVELTQSSSDAKHLFDQMVAQKLSEGFKAYPDYIASEKAKGYTDVWISWRGKDSFFIYSYSNSAVSPSWLLETQE